jgi:hypothetical protein
MTPEAALNFMKSIMEIYVQPEMQRRESEGAPLAEALWAAQIIFQDGNDPPVIRLNSKVRLIVRVNDSVEWINLAELRRGGSTRIIEGRVVADEIGMRHITIYQVAGDEEWKILFDTLGNQTLVDNQPGLGTVFASPDANAPPLDKLANRIDQLFSAVCVCLDKDHLESAMILVYSGIDAFAWLNRPSNVDDVRRTDFEQWLDTYFLLDSGFNCTSLDLYAARCGLVHSNTSESRLNREDRAHKVFYYRQGENVKIGVIQLLMNERLPPWFIDVDAFVKTLHAAIERFWIQFALMPRSWNLFRIESGDLIFQKEFCWGLPQTIKVHSRSEL